MSHHPKNSVLALFLLGAGPMLGLALPTQAQNGPWQAVEFNLRRRGEEKDGVLRVTFPRSDLQVKVGSVRIRTGLALTSWAAFQRTGNSAMMMGDLVLLSSELPAVTSKLVESGIEITAVHNHLAEEQPRVLYVHFHGHGFPGQMALALRRTLELTGTPLSASPSQAPAEELTSDAQKLSKIFGRSGTQSEGIVSFAIPRAETIASARATLGPQMGVATAINFQLEGSDSVTTGDFVLLEKEVQPVIRALRANGIEITALHSHMLDENPRLFFLHFWGRGETNQLARGLRAALDVTNHTK